MTAPLRLLFFGASAFAVPTLRRLAHAEHEIVAVYTQPDRPAGRGRRLRSSPVAGAARELGLTLEQPEKIRGAAQLERLRAYAPDAVVLAAYGLLIPQATLGVPRLGWLNVHPSLLPRYRGAAPVAAPILAGDAQTGVSVFLMRAGLDDGPILSQVATPIGPAETARELTERLAELGSGLLVETLRGWAAGEVEPVEQDESRASYAPKLTREEALLDWSEPAAVLSRRVRAYNPWPVAFTYWNGERLRILRAEPAAAAGAGEPGAVAADGAGWPVVSCGSGALLLGEVQPAGARPMTGKAFATGRPGFLGSRLTSDPVHYNAVQTN